MVRVQPPALDALDRWIAAQPDRKPTRPEAIRRLINLGLWAAEHSAKGGPNPEPGHLSKGS